MSEPLTFEPRAKSGSEVPPAVHQPNRGVIHGLASAFTWSARVGQIDMGAQAEVPSARRPDTPRPM